MRREQLRRKRCLGKRRRREERPLTHDVVLEAIGRVAKRWATEGLPQEFLRRQTFWVIPEDWPCGPAPGPQAEGANQGRPEVNR
jgi:hypothetical protein